MLQEGPAAAVPLTVAAQLQLGSISCTPNHHHFSYTLTPSRPVHSCWKWLACTEYLSSWFCIM